MAKPRVFVSSTFYDLKHVRASLEVFINAFGYEPILSEKGDVTYTPDVALDESCYREVQNSDIYVLIVGGRYGSEISESKTSTAKEFFDRYESITKHEYQSAVSKDIPIYILIGKAVYAEYQTFRRNRDNEAIKYAHVDSVNIFHLMDDILSQPRNNPIYAFESHSDIESWLKEQWAGLFRELIQRLSGHQQLSSLSAQVSELSDINTTLKRYLEALLTAEEPEKSKDLISMESQRLFEGRLLNLINNNSMVQYLNRRHHIDQSVVLDALRSAENYLDFLVKIEEVVENSEQKGQFDKNFLMKTRLPFRDTNMAREMLGLPPFPDYTKSEKTEDENVVPVKRRTVTRTKKAKSE